MAARITKELTEFPPLADLRTELRQRLVEVDNLVAADRKEAERKLANLEAALGEAKEGQERGKEEVGGVGESRAKWKLCVYERVCVGGGSQWGSFGSFNNRGFMWEL